MGGVRRWLHHRWFHYVAGGLAGLLLASSLSFIWQQGFSQPAITLLGSGHGLSAVISTGSMRVLIVSGDDPIAFANAYNDAHPPTMRRIDLVILTPNASPHLAERAVALAAPQRIMAIERHEMLEGEPAINDPVRIIVSPRTIELGDAARIDIDPGLISGSPAAGWMIQVYVGPVSVVLTESVPFRPPSGASLIAIMGGQVSAAAQSLADPVAHAGDATTESGMAFGVIQPGETRRIPFERDSLVLPHAWIRMPEH